MPTVTVINGSVVATYPGDDDGDDTLYEWSWTVNVDGQVGVMTTLSTSNIYSEAAAAAVQLLESDPDLLGGIASNDGTDSTDNQDDQDDDDGVVASGGGDSYGDSA